MAQVDTAAQVDQGLAGLDPSLALPGDTSAIIRQLLPKAITLGAVVLGGALAYGMPALELSDGSTLSIHDVNKVLTFSTPSKGWFLPLSWFCGLFAIVMTLFMPEAERFATHGRFIARRDRGHGPAVLRCDEPDGHRP